MILALLLLAACKDGGDTALEPPEEAWCGTWTSVGHPTMLTYCTTCHSSQLDGHDRNEAPRWVDLDTLGGVRLEAERVAARVEAGDMPPGGGMPPEQAQRLLRWLECGAPGEPAALENRAEKDGSSRGMHAEALPTRVDGELVVERISEDGEWLLTEVYETFGGEGWLLSWEDARRRVVYDPPLPVWRNGQDNWSAQVSARIEQEGLSWTEEQSWTAQRGVGELDPRSPDIEAVVVLLLEEQGDEHRWEFSTSLGTVGRYLDDQSGTWWSQQAPGTPSYDYGLGFPLAEDQLWSEHILWRER